MGKGLLGSFATGVLQGVEKGLQRKARKERQDKLDKRDQDLHDLRMEEAERIKGDRAALADAVRPATVTQPQDVAMDDDGNPMPAAPSFEVSIPGQMGQRLDTRQAADAAAAQQNTPEAQAQRVSLAMMERGKPVEAMEFQSKAQKFADERWDRVLREAVPRGHAGLAEVMTRAGGPFAGKQVQAVPSPDGKTVTYAEVTPEGLKPTPFTFTADEEGVVRAGYALSRISPEARYKVMVDEDKRTAAAKVKERELDLKERHLTDVQMPLAEARGALATSQATAAEARATLAQAKAEAARKGGGDDKVSREKRLRWTSMHAESGRRLSDANKALSALTSGPGGAVFAVRAKQPGTPEAKQLADLQAEVQGYKEERALYGELLAGSQGKKAKEEREAAKGTAAPAAGKKLGSRASPHQPADKTAYEKIPKGDHYMHPTKGLQVKQ